MTWQAGRTMCDHENVSCILNHGQFIHVCQKLWKHEAAWVLTSAIELVHKVQDVHEIVQFHMNCNIFAWDITIACISYIPIKIFQQTNKSWWTNKCTKQIRIATLIRLDQLAGGVPLSCCHGTNPSSNAPTCYHLPRNLPWCHENAHLPPGQRGAVWEKCLPRWSGNPKMPYWPGSRIVSIQKYYRTLWFWESGHLWIFAVLGPWVRMIHNHHIFPTQKKKWPPRGSLKGVICRSQEAYLHLLVSDYRSPQKLLFRKGNWSVKTILNHYFPSSTILKTDWRHTTPQKTGLYKIESETWLDKKRLEKHRSYLGTCTTPHGWFALPDYRADCSSLSTAEKTAASTGHDRAYRTGI